ncbi:hypothetical protein NDU88_003483 [Pleurodeles waltl]|uniref:Uncharacterized protein n=1 Tax=Pleurodeles waltl TaxID=8319 RepID=A0AAV7LS68_PLEWA|nr:hypothetical protein NDU88_003483 [Pleurodeles waltl]
MEAATYPTLLRLRIPPAGDNSDDSNALWKLPRVLELTTSLGRLTTGDGSHVSGGATVRGRRRAAAGACSGVCRGGAGGGVCRGGAGGGVCRGGAGGVVCGGGAGCGVCGGMSLPSLRGTLAALMVGALHDPAVAGTTVLGDVVAEVLGWDLESLALGEGGREVKGRGQGLPGKGF